MKQFVEFFREGYWKKSSNFGRQNVSSKIQSDLSYGLKCYPPTVVTTAVSRLSTRTKVRTACPHYRDSACTLAQGSEDLKVSNQCAYVRCCSNKINRTYVFPLGWV